MPGTELGIFCITEPKLHPYFLYTKDRKGARERVNYTDLHFHVLIQESITVYVVGGGDGGKSNSIEFSEGVDFNYRK